MKNLKEKFCEKYFLTGSTGFIGSNINSYLINNGYSVTCVSRKKLIKILLN